MAPQRARVEKRVLSKQSVAKRRKGPPQEKPAAAHNPGRPIWAVLLLAFSLLTLVALATYEEHSHPGPGLRNAAGPAGRLVATLLLHWFGMCSYAAPVAGTYAAVVLFTGNPHFKRWTRLLAAVVFFLSFCVLAHLLLWEPDSGQSLPAGVVGRGLFEALAAQLSFAGTAIVVSAAMAVALILGSELAFLRACALVGIGIAAAAKGMARLVSTLWEGHQTWLKRQREKVIQANAEKAAFLAQLEADGEERSQEEREAAEAAEMADEAYRLSQEEWQRSPEPPEAAQDSGFVPSDRTESEGIRRLPQIVVAPTSSSNPPWALGPPPSTLPDPSVASGNSPAPGVDIASALARTPLIVEPKKPPTPPKRKEPMQFEFVGDRKSFTLPPLDVLECDKTERSSLDKEVFLTTAEKLRAKLADFGITGEVVEIRPGPVVTMYEFLPGPGIKLSKIASLADDLAMAMEAMRVRIVAPIPGKGVVGIEVPNRDRETVYLKEIAEQDVFLRSSSKLTMCLGKDIEGMPYVLDLARAPHLLIAGTTGSGKSVAVNSMIMSILLKSTPEEVRFLMVDPKMLELSAYEGIPHLLLPVVTDPKKAALALRWAVEEMERRYQVLSEAGVRNIAGYNKLVENSHLSTKSQLRSSEQHPKRSVTPALDPPPARKLLVVDVANGETEDDALQRANLAKIGVPAPEEPSRDIREPIDGSSSTAPEPTRSEVQGGIAASSTGELKKLPYIVVIIDELADLMMVAPREVEIYVARLAQMARASGIHLLVATQRPSTDVVTGVIKSNFPTRISFMLRTRPDSMTILGTSGAEALLGMGDMLLMPPTSAHLQRVHGAYVSEVEIRRAVEHLKAQGKPVFDESILRPREDELDSGVEDELSDELYDQALAAVSEMRQVSISMLQRKMRIGYNRAARMIERMERDGVVGPPDGAKPRDVLIRPLGEMPGAGAL